MDSRNTSLPPTDERPVNGRGCFLPGDRVAVVLPLPVRGAYDYLVGSEMTLSRGDYVRVPFGRTSHWGVVWGEGTGDIEAVKLKPVSQKYSAHPLPMVSRDFVDWVARYTLSGRGSVLKMTTPVPDALDPPRPETVYGLRHDQERPAKLTPTRERVLDVLMASGGLPLSTLARESGCSTGVVKGLVDLGLVEASARIRGPLFRTPDPDIRGPVLSSDQRAIADELVATIDGGYRATLLDGVPGAGKTEVYFEAVAACLKAGRQALVLLPEIALSAQWLARFQDRFGVKPAVWHSDVTQATRRETWRDIISGDAPIIVGARSALFLPYSNLGLIVVDEEHDQSFKQDDGVSYNARDMAVLRASLGKIPVVLASATPSVESVNNARTGRYQLAELAARHGGAALPEIEAIDLKASPPERGRFIAPRMISAISTALSRGEQAMLYLNRRGYAPLTLCRTCGHRIECPRCTAWLVEHRRTLGGPRLQCHHCGYNAKLPEHCPSCGAEDSFAACGPGVERLEDEVKALFPEARLLVASSDTIWGPEQAQELVQKVEDHEVDLIIGTQLVAKGYHFPLLTLVGVIDADLGLAGGDLRAAERTYQLLYQVSGRAGRGEKPGRVFLQTHLPDHPVMAALLTGDRDAFLNAELASREATSMPPFGRLVGIIVSGRDESAVDQAARDLARTAPQGADIAVLGPAPAPMAVLRGRHRRRLLVKAGKAVNVQSLVRPWVSAIKTPGNIRISVDVDPYSFM